MQSRQPETDSVAIGIDAYERGITHMSSALRNPLGFASHLAKLGPFVFSPGHTDIMCN